MGGDEQTIPLQRQKGAELGKKGEGWGGEGRDVGECEIEGKEREQIYVEAKKEINYGGKDKYA